MKNKKLTNSEISTLCMELSLMIHSGINVSDGLHLLLEDTGREMRTVLSGIMEQINNGTPLSQAMKLSGVFPDYVCGLTACGEQTGRMEEALQSLSEYYDGRKRLENHIRSALLYPSVLLLLMLVVIGILLVKVLPVFNKVFESLGGQLTGLAGGLLVLGKLLDNAMPVLLALLVLTVVSLAAILVSDRFRRRVLHDGGRGISRKIAAARFSRVMAMGMASGMSAEETLELAALIQPDNKTEMQKYRECQTRLEQGDGLAKALKETGLLPAESSRMLALGISSGSGDTVMQEIARRMEENSEYAIEERVGYVEPTLVIITSILVGVILLSVMLPLMNIMAAIG